jgi:hypothetical protein
MNTKQNLGTDDKPVLIKGTELTDEQRSKLKFNGMQNPDWVNSHSFYFINNKPAPEDSDYYYPVMNSASWLPY